MYDLIVRGIFVRVCMDMEEVILCLEERGIDIYSDDYKVYEYI